MHSSMHDSRTCGCFRGFKQSPAVVQANEQVMHVRCTGGPRPRFARQRSRRHSRTGGRGLHVGAGVVIAHLRGRRIGARVTAQLLAGKDVVGTTTLIWPLATQCSVRCHLQCLHLGWGVIRCAVGVAACPSAVDCPAAQLRTCVAAGGGTGAAAGLPVHAGGGAAGRRAPGR